ncbi:50S ribosomal protein L25 [Candidatus Kaiserbacteria bacterium]|nr:50S ribosomal protein L25 [Candidatus Kaiserbacteria bacterium]USN91858.1 MAG: 50S ribosomal protein L25 [Candidatus Nomurabacteria bacterium]
MTITLSVTKRDEATTTDKLRANGIVPAVVYGPKQEPVHIAIDGREFDKVRKEAGESTIVELTGLEKPIEVLIKEVDFNPLKQQIMHADFYAIERGKEMTVHVGLEFIGEAPVESSRAGSVTKVLHEIEVTCLPRNLPSHIDVDISSLVEVTDKIHVSDLNIPEGVTVEGDLDDIVAVVSVTKETSEEEDTDSSVDMDSIEVESKGKIAEGEEDKS